MWHDKNTELNFSELCLERILTHIPHYVFWKDVNFRYQGCNENFAKVCGLQSPIEIVNRSDYELPWNQIGADIYRTEDEVVIHGKSILNKEVPLITHDGLKRIISVSKVPLRDKSNTIIGILGIYTDVTERKEYETALLEAKILAEIANKAKSEFMANMSHDLRTPLSGILGIAEILDMLETDTKKKEFIKDLKISGEKLLFFLSEILEYCQLNADGVPNRVVSFNVMEIVNDVISLLQVEARRKNIDLHAHFHPEILKLGMVNGDKHKFHRILLNLVNNAVKFTFKGQVVINLEKPTVKNENIVLNFNVEDTGIGIPKDKFDIIFDRFIRLEPSHLGRFEGNGLGLQIVKKFIEDMAGQITVESTLHVGSKFHFVIPFKR